MKKKSSKNPEWLWLFVAGCLYLIRENIKKDQPYLKKKKQQQHISKNEIAGNANQHSISTQVWTAETSPLQLFRQSSILSKR